ncbi:MAG: c-type cytochrome [Ginsengibacter sp.]
MKKVFTICSCFLLLMSCGGNDSSAPVATEKKAEEAPVEAAPDPKVAKGLELVSKSDCFTCHKLTEASIGPSYAAVAAKYKTLDQPAMDSMVKQIKNGGSGKWGTVPMTPHPAIVREDAEAMVYYIMSIK